MDLDVVEIAIIAVKLPWCQCVFLLIKSIKNDPVNEDGTIIAKTNITSNGNIL